MLDSDDDGIPDKYGKCNVELIRGGGRPSPQLTLNFVFVHPPPRLLKNRRKERNLGKTRKRKVNRALFCSSRGEGGHQVQIF